MDPPWLRPMANALVALAVLTVLGWVGILVTLRDNSVAPGLVAAIVWVGLMEGLRNRGLRIPRMLVRAGFFVGTLTTAVTLIQIEQSISPWWFVGLIVSYVAGILVHFWALNQAE